MQHKQRFTNVTLVTPSGEEDKDLLIEGDKIAQILNRNENLSDDWKIVDGHNNYIFPGMIDVLQHGFMNYLYGHAEENCTVDNAKLLPKHGVYAVKVELIEGVFFGMLNISDKTLKIEVNIFNFSQEIYDCNIVVRVLNRLRNEKEIGSLEDLKMQLIKDKNKCMKLLNLF